MTFLQQLTAQNFKIKHIEVRISNSYMRVLCSTADLFSAANEIIVAKLSIHFTKTTAKILNNFKMQVKS
jgi:hypothetical protein